MILRRGPFQADLVEHVRYIARDDPDAAVRLVDAVESTLRALEQMPRLGRQWRSSLPRLRGVRYRAARGFPNHLVFYRPAQGGIEALRLLHAARDLERALRTGPS